MSNIQNVLVLNYFIDLRLFNFIFKGLIGSRTMGAIDYYTCQNCGSNINYDNIFFYFDGTKEETIDFLHLFSTVGIDARSKIKGRINITFCKHCKKTFKIYIINEGNIKNPKDILYEYF